MWVAQREKRVSIAAISLMMVGVVYGLGSMTVLSATAAGLNPEWSDFIDPQSTTWPFHQMLAFLVFGSILLGYVVAKPAIPREIFRQSSHPKAHRDLRRSFWWILIAAVLIQLAHTWDYGGPLAALDHGEAVRSSRPIAENRLSFLKPLASLAFFSSLGFYGLLLSGRRALPIATGFLIATAFSLYILYYWVGRMGFLIFLASFPLAWLTFRTKSPALLVGILALAAPLGLAAIYFISNALGIKGGDSFLGFVAREISFPFGSFSAWMDAAEVPTRFFSDIMAMPIFALPERVWSNWIVPAGDLNTALINGAPKGEEGVTGAIPIDILTLGYLQFGGVGVGIVSALFGALLAFLDRALMSIPNRGVAHSLAAYVALKIGFMGVFYADTNQFVKSNLGLLLTFVILAAVMGLATRKRLSRSSKSQPAR